jgi:hypothetical protein
MPHLRLSIDEKKTLLMVLPMLFEFEGLLTREDMIRLNTIKWKLEGKFSKKRAWFEAQI